MHVSISFVVDPTSVLLIIQKRPNGSVTVFVLYLPGSLFYAVTKESFLSSVVKADGPNSDFDAVFVVTKIDFST